MQNYRLMLDETGGADHQKNRWRRKSTTTGKGKIIDHGCGGGKRQRKALSEQPKMYIQRPIWER
eukprot:4950871-Heterocapsa_arctica.AAC.1